MVNPSGEAASVRERLDAYNLPNTWLGWLGYGFMMIVASPWAMSGRKAPLAVAFAGWILLMILMTLGRVLIALRVENEALASLLDMLVFFPVTLQLCKVVWLAVFSTVTLTAWRWIKRMRVL